MRLSLYISYLSALNCHKKSLSAAIIFVYYGYCCFCLCCCWCSCWVSACHISTLNLYKFNCLPPVAAIGRQRRSFPLFNIYFYLFCLFVCLSCYCCYFDYLLLLLLLLLALVNVWRLTLGGWTFYGVLFIYDAPFKSMKHTVRRCRLNLRTNIANQERFPLLFLRSFCRFFLVLLCANNNHLVNRISCLKQQQQERHRKWQGNKAWQQHQHQQK